AGPAARTAAVSGAGARRLRVGRAAVAVARPRLGVGLLGGFLGPPTRAGRVGGVAQASLAGRARSRRPAPRRRPSRRADSVDAAHLDRVAARDAHHRPPRTSPSWRPVAHHRRRRLAHHRVRHQYRRGPHRRSGGAPRLRARAEDRIRGLKDTGMTNLPLQAFTKNQIWLELACLAYELLTWTQLLAFHDQPARTWEPKRLRLRLLAVAARLITTGRRRILRLSKRWPWTDLITTGHQRLVALA